MTIRRNAIMLTAMPTTRKANAASTAVVATAPTAPIRGRKVQSTAVPNHRPRVRPVMQDGHCIGLSGYADDSLERNFESLGRRDELDVGGCNDELAYRLQRQVLLLDGSALERIGANGTALHQA
jgi:hypothetical protein